ncbi:MAG: CxxC-x17-CxxC domain-containing protein [Candidatus Falkowbacteria bacterium]
MGEFKSKRKPGGFGGGNFKSGGGRGTFSKPERTGFGGSDRGPARNSFGGNDRGGRSSFGDRGDRGPARGGFDRPMHKAICSECGKNCEVPFRPTGEKPVLCSFCYSDQQSGGTKTFGNREHGKVTTFHSSSEKPFESATDYSKQFEALNTKLDKIMAILTSTKMKEDTALAASEVENHEPSTQVKPKKISEGKAKSSAKKKK